MEHLTKRYVLRHQRTEPYTMLRDVIAQSARRLVKRGQRSQGKEEFLALDDVSFQVEQGDRLGIIGRNGAGKSTLLKILSRIVAPTKGRIVIDGRVASLLEVGTGFHPELSGRENIFLNGAILGMSRSEIASKFDEIVAFAEVERFLDTPVKRYSSGMYVRLAFAVAAHLEPEILIVDEVLAVGDAAFQRKCLGKMEAVSGEGRTILFVSHQMDAVQRLCNKGLLLNKGKAVASGPIASVVTSYLSSDTGSAGSFTFDPPTEPTGGRVGSLAIHDRDGGPLDEVPVGAHWEARIRFVLDKPFEGAVIALGISTMLDLPIRTTWSKPASLGPGRYEAIFVNDGTHLTSGRYKLVIGLSEQGRVLHYLPEEASLTISEISTLTGDDRIVNLKSGLLVNQMATSINRLD